MFISFEGIDCSGKSTQVDMLSSALRALGYEVLVTREPGGTEAGEKMRDILKQFKLSPMSQTLLLYAARYQHVHEVILPALKEGKIVISDRFDDSTIAYQHYGSNLPLETIETLREISIGTFKPDLSFLINIDMETRNERMQVRNLDIIEREESSFHNRVIEGYREIAKREKGRFVILDGKISALELSKDILQEVLKRKGER